MRVLFISSGNSPVGINVIVRNQGESLIKAGASLEYFTINGRGLLSYLKHIPQLRKHRKNRSYDVFHAHYSLSGMVAALAGCKPLILSLMGSDTQLKTGGKILLRLFSRIFFNSVIVKSEDMARRCAIKKLHVIPNGVNIDKVRPESINHKPLTKRKIILFAANPERKSKNFALAKEAFENVKRDDIELKVVHGLPHEELIKELNDSDLLLLTSLWEGSPNIIKEAMACNIPAVATDVGDIRWLFGETEGYYIASHDPGDIAAKIEVALCSNKQPQGRDRIKAINLDTQSIANKIINIYKIVT